jgi:hypothetical protein
MTTDIRSPRGIVAFLHRAPYTREVFVDVLYSKRDENIYGLALLEVPDGVVDMPSLCDFIAHNAHCREVRVIDTDVDVAVLCNAIQSVNRIERICIARALSDEDVRSICEMVRHSTTLTSLMLNECCLLDDHCALLAEVLKHNRTLKMLDIQRNRFGAVGVGHFLDALRGNYTLHMILYTELNGDTLESRQLDTIGTANFFASGDVVSACRDADHGFGFSGDFDELPNEMLCSIAERVWPTTSALTFSHVCRRFYDVMFSDYVVKHRAGRYANGTWTHGNWHLLYRNAFLEDPDVRRRCVLRHAVYKVIAALSTSGGK